MPYRGRRRRSSFVQFFFRCLFFFSAAVHVVIHSSAIVVRPSVRSPRNARFFRVVHGPVVRRRETKINSVRQSIRNGVNKVKCHGIERPSISFWNGTVRPHAIPFRTPDYKYYNLKRVLKREYVLMYKRNLRFWPMRNTYKRYFIVYISIALRTLFGYFTQKNSKHYTDTYFWSWTRECKFNSELTPSECLHFTSIVDGKSYWDLLLFITPRNLKYESSS